MSGTTPAPRAGAIATGAFGQLRECEALLDRSTLGLGLLELVRLRVSQINGCGFCIARHRAALQRCGESDERIGMLPDWTLASAYSARERAALAWAEHLAASQAPASAGAALRDQFSETEITELTLAIAMIGLWNRLALGLGW